jgi:hypothetical protein
LKESLESQIPARETEDYAELLREASKYKPSNVPNAETMNNLQQQAIAASNEKTVRLLESIDRRLAPQP